MTDFLKIAKSIAVHFAHICAYGIETIKVGKGFQCQTVVLVMNKDHPVVDTIITYNKE